LPINFVRVKQVRVAADPNRRKFALVGLLAVAVLGALGFYGYTVQANLDAEWEDLSAQKKELEARAALAEEDDKRFKAVADWVGGEIVWLDELYDLTDRFPDHKGMRLTQVTGDPLPRTAKSKQIAKMALKGVVNNDEAPKVDDLLNGFVKDGHYRVSPKVLTRNTGTDRFFFPQQFTTRVELEKALPTQYARQLPEAPPEPKDEQPNFGFPGFGGGN
jgi:hypothetical protein